MSMQQDPEVYERLKDGTYYEEARKWYSEVYMSLISERVFYVILTTIAGLTFLLSLLALIRLLPIVPTEPLVIFQDDVAHKLPIIKKLAETGENPDVGLRRYFVEKYVEYRENYDRDKIASQARAVYNLSDKDTYDYYRRLIDVSNPRSPVVRYESRADRSIDVLRMQIEKDETREGGFYKADVYFVAYLNTFGNIEESYWSADLEFEYVDAKVEQLQEEGAEAVADEDKELKVIPMQFKVTSYNVREKKKEKAK